MTDETADEMPGEIFHSQDEVADEMLDKKADGLFHLQEDVSNETILFAGRNGGRIFVIGRGRNILFPVTKFFLFHFSELTYYSPLDK